MLEIIAYFTTIYHDTYCNTIEYQKVINYTNICYITSAIIKHTLKYHSTIQHYNNRTKYATISQRIDICTILSCDIIYYSMTY